MAIDFDNMMLLDVQYVKADRQNQKPDCLYTIYKDLRTDEKHILTIESPKFPIYFEKEEEIDHVYPVDYQYLDKCTEHVCKYSDIPFEIAKHMGDNGKRFLQNIFDTRNYKELRMLNTYPHVFGHDYDIRTYYRYAWRKNAKKTVVPIINKAYLDIECDSFDVHGFPRPDKNPIDLVTIIDDKTKTSHTFALVNRPYKQRGAALNSTSFGSMLSEKTKKRLEEEENYREEMYHKRHEQERYLMDHQDELRKELHEMFDESYPGMEYQFHFYEDERKMLIHLFQCIHLLNPDFVLVWNIGFDIPYILERMKALGLNPADIICDEEFKDKNKVCYFVKDRRNFDIKNKSDHFVCTSKTIWIDQMENYAAIRKGRDELRSYSLNYIGEKEVEDTKLDYSESGNLKVLGYVDYKKYFIYNIKDVLLQHGIEHRTEDIDALYSNSYANLTAYEDCYKQTVVLRNVQYRIYRDNGIIPGANVNQIYLQKDMEEHPEKYAKKGKGKPDFEGAIVGDTRLIEPFGKEMYGKKTNFLFHYSIDMDMTAFYPSTIIELNIAPSTLLFKVIVNASNYDVRGGDIPFHGFTDVQLLEDNIDSFSGDISAEIFDNFQTGNILSTGHKWLNLPTVTELDAALRRRLRKAA